MTREELKKHCQKQIEACEMWAKHNGEEPHGKNYEEHKLILELLEQEPKSEWQKDHEILKAYSDGANGVLDELRAEIERYGSIWVAYAITDETKTDKGIEKLVSDVLKQAKEQVLNVIDKYKTESEVEE